VKNGTNECALPALIGDVITDQKHYIDNLFADTWKRLKFNARIKGAGFTKRSGIDITEAVFLLLLWKWINVSSIAMFSRKALGMFSRAKKDVMYDLLKRECCQSDYFTANFPRCFAADSACDLTLNTPVG